MSEKAILTPLTGDEIITIACAEFRKRLRSLSPLMGNKEYSGFEISFEHRIKLFVVGGGFATDKQTLAWGTVGQGEGVEEQMLEDKAQYLSSPDVNAERINHEMPLTLEVSDGRGGLTRKKVKVK